jgi:hypothetical protein
MKLESEGQRAITDPQGSQIRDAVSALSLPAPRFLVLSRSRTSYLQVAIAAPNQFLLEYREGGVQQHFRSARTDLSGDEVVRMLEAHQRDDDSWRRGKEWRRIGAPAARDIWDRVSMICAGAGLTLIVVAAGAARRSGGGTVLGMEPMQLFSIAFLVFLPSAIIDLRRFGAMDVQGKVRTVAALCVGVVAVLYLIQRFASR